MALVKQAFLSALALVLAPVIADYAGAWLRADDVELIAVVHRSNPVDYLSRGQLRKIFLGEIRHWPDPKRVILVQRDPDSTAYRSMLRILLGMTRAEYRQHLLSVEFRGDAPLTVKILNSNEAAGKFVSYVPAAIALVDASTLTNLPSDTKAVRIDNQSSGRPAYALR